jgi:hypothetical protein
MSEEVPFHATRMGQQFYERTLPELVRQITRLAEAVEKLSEQQRPGEAK